MVDVIERSYAARTTLTTVSAALRAKPERLRAKFRQVTGISVHEYVTRVRLDHAEHYIRSGDKIDAIALAVGYQSKKNFYRQFRRHFGVTPVIYRGRRTPATSQITGSVGNGRGRSAMTTYTATFAGVDCLIDVELRQNVKGRPTFAATPFVMLEHGIQPFLAPPNVEVAADSEAEALERAATFLEHRFGLRQSSPQRYKNGVRRILTSRP
jgi:AraC-like DNA-binding protein